MIISKPHKFCFFSVPRTASTAISKFLIEHFNGEQRGLKHSAYVQFIDKATPEEKEYFTFAGIRHPMDSAISEYFKKKNDHNGKFSAGKQKNGRPIHDEAIKRYQYLVDTDASFSEYFLKFYTEPYGLGFHNRTLKYMDLVIRYECLETDFIKACYHIGLDVTGITLPKVNPTKKEGQHFQSFYTPEAVERAKEVFGFFMDQYGYSVS